MRSWCSVQLHLAVPHYSIVIAAARKQRNGSRNNGMHASAILLQCQAEYCLGAAGGGGHYRLAQRALQREAIAMM